MPTLEPTPIGLAPRDDKTVWIVAAAFAALLHVGALLVPWRHEPRLLDAPLRSEPLSVTPISIPAPPMPETQPMVFEPLARKEPFPVPPRPDLLTLAAEPSEFRLESEVPLVEGLPVELGAVAPPPPTRPSGPVESDLEGLVLPRRLDEIEPDYPPAARVGRREADVRLRAVVDRDGRVTEIELVAGPGFDLGFVDAATDAVRRWRYEPGRLEGEPVAVRIEILVSFRLQ